MSGRTRVAFLFAAAVIAVPAVFAYAASGAVELVRQDENYSSVRIEPAHFEGQAGIALFFECSEDLHYYSNPKTAPAGYNLQVDVRAETLDFREPIMPASELFTDPTGKKVEVFGGDFTVFVPLDESQTPAGEEREVSIEISGIACTSIVCLQPFEKTLTRTLDTGVTADWPEVELDLQDEKPTAAAGPGYSVGFALLLALAAGLVLNVMPCVWPVLPMIVMRIVQQAKDEKGRSVSMGLAFCCGILLFFASLAAVNIVLRLSYGTVLGWGDPFRSPAFVTGTVIVLVGLAMFMFGLVNFTVPSSIAGKSGSGKGYFGSVGMGFLAAILGTPCGFGILAAAFGWAQTQNLPIATLTIMTIGLGMALPYGVLILMPGLLKKLPKPGKWMELIKQAIGFTLLVIAVKFLAALSAERRTGVLYFSVFLAVAIWMWGSWVDFNTSRIKKYVVRLLAIGLVGVSGWIFLTPEEELIDWRKYDANLVEDALAEDKPVLIKFTAEWCLNCAVVDKLIYADKDISGLIEEKGVVPVKADTTENDFPATIALKQTYGESGTLPVTMYFAPGADEPVRWRGTNFKAELKDALENIEDADSDDEEEGEKENSEEESEVQG